MIPPQVGMRLQTKKGKGSQRAQNKKREAKEPNEKKGEKIREKERRDNVTILFHTCASK
jgi:hypothetical protein